MNENQYRLAKLIVMAVAVVGLLIIGYQMSQKGRYVPVEHVLNVVDTSTGQGFSARPAH